MTDFAATIPECQPIHAPRPPRRRLSEIDVINGQVVALSRELGLEAPYNETLSAIVRQREKSFG